MITFTLASDNSALTVTHPVLLPRLLTSVGDDRTSYQGNQRGQVITFKYSEA